MGEGSVWAVSGGGDVLKRFAAADGAEQAAIALPSNGFGVLVAHGAVWVTSPANDELYRIDPASNRVVSTTELSSRPRIMVADADSIWVYNDGDGTVQRVDGVSGKVTASVPTGTSGRAAITAGGGYVWVKPRGLLIIQIDPRNNAVRGRFHVPDYGTNIGYAGGSLWLSGDAVRRIRPPE